MWHGTRIAVKQFHNQSSEQEFKHEIRVAGVLGNHDHVVPFFGACLTPPNLAIVMKLMPFGSVEDLLIKKKAFPLHLDPKDNADELLKNFRAVTQIAVDASSSILHCHAKRVIHADIAARNFLVNELNRSYVCDFGLSVILNEGETVHSRDPKACVPLQWTAPEVLEENIYSEKTDVFAFAMFLFEIIARTEPYPDFVGVGWVPDMLKRDNPLRPTIPHFCPKPLARLIMRCWHPDSATRPTMKQINEKLIGIWKRFHDASELDDAYEPLAEDANVFSTAKHSKGGNDAPRSDESKLYSVYRREMTISEAVIAPRAGNSYADIYVMPTGQNVSVPSEKGKNAEPTKPNDQLNHTYSNVSTHTQKQPRYDQNNSSDTFQVYDRLDPSSVSDIQRTSNLSFRQCDECTIDSASRKLCV